jgi:glycosidase
MRNEMLKAMHWWMDSIGIDGFRCDVAGEVPTDFWNWAMGDLRKTHKDMLTLAEDEDKAQELTESAFDMYYGWSLHHDMNEVAQGKKTVNDLWANFAKADSTIRPEAIRMNFITNHDENSWNGTEQERMGDAVNLFAAFCYVVPGMPMIYTGQLSGNHHRLEFFEKDLIDTDEAFAQADLYQTLNALRMRNKALFSPEAGAPMLRIPADNEHVFACARNKEGKWYTNTVIAVMNMSGEEQEVTLDLNGYEGNYRCLCGKEHELAAEQHFTLKPWGFKIFEK